MKINNYILKTYNTINAYSGTNSLSDEFYEKGYVVVTDENNNFIGILNPVDLIKKPHKLIIDCIEKKEHICINENVVSALKKFRKYNSQVLPVFDDEDKFIGIIEKQDLLDKLKSIIIELHKQTLISKNAKTAFLRNLSHEIRTPLNGISGFIEIISKIDIDNIDTIKNHFKIKTEKFLLIMNDLMDLALIDAGEEVEIKNEKFRINDVFADLQLYFETLISITNKKILLLSLNKEHNLIINSDKTKVKQILYHLIDNAIKFADNESIVKYGYRLENKEIIFFVSNQGIIDDEIKNKLFLIFEKQYNKNNQIIEGLGIGLSLVKKLSNLLNAKVHFEINDNQTTFYFRVNKNIVVENGKSLMNL